jgi:hypothetical protein
MSTEQNNSKKFSPFYGQGLYEIVPPLRKNKKRICRILAETEGFEIEQRVMYAKEAGIKITPNIENELANTYTEDVGAEELCLVLFDLERNEIDDFELMNEGEVIRALKYFFMCRIGIY